MESSVLAALKPMARIGPPRIRQSIGAITPSVVFSATVSTVARMISDSESSEVSRPTMRPTCFRPRSSEMRSACATPRPSLARHFAEMQVQAIRPMPISSAISSIRYSTNSTTAVAAMLRSTVEAVSHTAPRRRFPPRARSFFSMKEIYLPIQITGWGQPSGSPMHRSSAKPMSIAAMFHLKNVMLRSSS